MRNKTDKTARRKAAAGGGKHAAQAGPQRDAGPVTADPKADAGNNTVGADHAKGGADGNANGNADRDAGPAEDDAEQTADADANADESDAADTDAGNADADTDAAADAAQCIAALKQQLLQARCRLAACEAGIDPGRAADAVTLALAQLRAADPDPDPDPDPDAVAEALRAVLARNPAWRAGQRAAGGFRLGADDLADADPDGMARPDRDGRKRWNRFR